MVNLDLGTLAAAGNGAWKRWPGGDGTVFFGAGAGATFGGTTMTLQVAPIVDSEDAPTAGNESSVQIGAGTNLSATAVGNANISLGRCWIRAVATGGTPTVRTVIARGATGVGGLS